MTYGEIANRVEIYRRWIWIEQVLSFSKDANHSFDLDAYEDLLKVSGDGRYPYNKCEAASRKQPLKLITQAELDTEDIGERTTVIHIPFPLCTISHFPESKLHHPEGG